jgi:MFS family permease
LTDGQSENYDARTSSRDPHMQRFRRPALVLAAYLGTFLASLDISIVNVALPTLQQALHTDMAGLQWVINAYASPCRR